MKRPAMGGIFILWALHIAGVSSLKIVPFKVQELVYRMPQTRIYGGTEVKEGEYPFMIFVRIELPDKKLLQCSASILTEGWVLTAAHCLEKPDIHPRNIILIGGRADLNEYFYNEFYMNQSLRTTELGVEERRAKELLIHPNFTHSEEEIWHDVALIKPEKPFTAANIKPIPLSFEKITSKKSCTILGWGRTLAGSTLQLNAVQRKEISTTSIGCKFQKSQPLICLKSDGLEGICHGDSGSPLVCEGKVWGVASYIITEREICEDSLEEYYTELSAERDWIESVLNARSRSVQTNSIRLWFFLFPILLISSKFLK